jgi:hypothetical protein
MGHVHSNHEEVTRADARRFSLAVGPVKSAKLADLVIVANFEKTLLALELHVLWLAANHGVLENPVSRADSGKSLDDGVGADLAVWADFHIILDYGCGVNSHFWLNLQNLQDFEDNGVLWILQILFMMHDVVCFE